MLGLWVLVALIFWAATAVIPGIAVPSFGAALLTTAADRADQRPALAAADPALPPAHRAHLRPRLAGAERAVVTSSRSRSWTGALPTSSRRCWSRVVLSVSLMLLTPALSFDDDARQLRVVRRRARAGPRGQPHRRPRRDHVRDRRPRRARPATGAQRGSRADDGALDRGGQPPRSSPGSATSRPRPGASQAGLLLGSNHDMPAFRWYEKESGKTMVSNHGKDAVEIERRHSDGGGLLAVGGASRGNMFSGDAPRCSATMSVLRDRQRSGAKRVLRLLRRPLRLHPHARALPLGRAPGAACRAPPAKGAARSTSTAAASTR